MSIRKLWFRRSSYEMATSMQQRLFGTFFPFKTTHVWHNCSYRKTPFWHHCPFQKTPFGTIFPTGMTQCLFGAIVPFSKISFWHNLSNQMQPSPMSQSCRKACGKTQDLTALMLPMTQLSPWAEGALRGGWGAGWHLGVYLFGGQFRCQI